MRSRLTILLTTLGLFALVYARLWSRHANIGVLPLSYPLCKVWAHDEFVVRVTCAGWRTEALVEALAVVLFGGAAFVYVGRRPAEHHK